MTNHTIALVFLVLLTGGCASQKQAESLQKSQEDLRAQMQQQAELLQLQSAYLRYLEDEHYALRAHLEQAGPEPQDKTEPAAGGTDKATTAPPPPAPAPVRPVTDLDGKLILGSQEWVWFDLFKSDVPVAVDDERKFSLLSVIESQPFERDGREWVSFAVDLPSGKPGAEKLQFEAPLERSVKLRVDPDGQLESRPVVKLTIKIGPVVEDVQFALVPDTGAEQVATLGRTFLRDIALVDSSRKFIQPQHSSR